jgi:peptidoglycan/LPS O-acetylase OafA/YrhL
VYWILAPQGGHFQYFKRFFESIIGCALILFCLSDSFTRARNILLENRVMYQLGLVSYGIYLYHYALPWFYTEAKQNLHLSFGKYSPLIDYSLMMIILLVLSFLSYYKIERPILKLKKKFKYHQANK